MKKAIFATLASLAFASTAFAAAPVMDLGAGQTQIGYSYDSLQTNIATLGDLGTYHANDYQLAYGLTNKLAITGNYLDSGSRSFVYNGTSNIDNLKFDSTQIGLQYKLTNNIAVSAGSLKSELGYDAGSSASTETFGGIAYQQNLGHNLAGYASYLKSTNVEDWKAGLNYNLSNSTSLDVGYRHYQNDGTAIVAKGVGFGLNHKF
jgi:hypothetical protein